jgi:hypothetical protein
MELGGWWTFPVRRWCQDEDANGWSGCIRGDGRAAKPQDVHDLFWGLSANRMVAKTPGHQELDMKGMTPSYSLKSIITLS